MADSSSAPPPSAGFKLKLKLGGGNSSTVTASSSAPSTSSSTTPSVSIPASSSSATIATPRLPVPSTSTSSIHTLYDNNKPSDVYMEDDGLPPEDDDDPHGADDFVPPADEVVEDNADYLAGGAKKKASRSRKKGSSTPADQVDPAASLPATYSFQFPPGLGISPSASPAPPSKKKKASGGTSTPSSNAGSAAASGSGRGWRKGLKGKHEAGSNDYMLPGASGAGPPAALKRKRPAYGEDGGEGEDDEEFMPAMVAPGGLATSEKWANGLPGGNEQSRATAAMAAAVNKVFPVGQPPKTGSGFLVPQPLDKNTPRPRSWAKAKREIIGPSGVPFYVSVWIGNGQSPYADHMLTHPRPPPIEKKPLTSHLETGSPHPEKAASRAGSEAGGSAIDDADGPGAAKKPKARRKPAAPRKKAAAATTAVPVQQVAPVVLAPPPAQAFLPPQ